MTTREIAKICHDTNRSYCETLGDQSQNGWELAPDWQQVSVVKGVEFHLANPGSPPSRSHEEWLKEKKATGWRYGAVKDPEKKEHPCFVAYEQLPKSQQAKDALFIGVVESLRKYVES
jgi:hypothetical protein